MGYIRKELLGEGGMAQVFRGVDEATGHEVALKVPHATSPELQARFLREAHAAMSLNHPNIVRALGIAEGPALVLELVRGESLRQRIRREGCLPVPETVRILREVLQALAYAHLRGVVHRDVSARNVLLDETGRVRLTDFGIARVAEDQTLTRTREVMGSARYLAPEQARGDSVGPETDLYAVGVLGYEMLTGQPPFPGDNPVQVALKHLNDSPPPLAREGVPAHVEATLLRALAKEPQDRFESAEEMAAALDGSPNLDRTMTFPPGWLAPPTPEPAGFPTLAGALRVDTRAWAERLKPFKTALITVALILTAVLLGALIASRPVSPAAAGDFGGWGQAAAVEER